MKANAAVEQVGVARSTRIWGLESWLQGLRPGVACRFDVLSLTRVLLPTAGYQRGCVYLKDPATMTLFPRLAIGTSRLCDFPPVEVGFLNFHLIELAFCSQRIIKHRRAIPSSESGAAAVRLAGTTISGVLYLEFQQKELPEDQLDQEIYAIRDAVARCLLLN